MIWGLLNGLKDRKADQELWTSKVVRATSFCYLLLNNIDVGRNVQGIRMSEENQALQRQLQLKREKELESSSTGDEWDDSIQSKEQVEANLLSKHDADMRKERALAYAYSHQQYHCGWYCCLHMHCLFCASSFTVSTNQQSETLRIGFHMKPELRYKMQKARKIDANVTTTNNGTWCIASSTASELDLQSALDWACGPGNVDCSAIQPSQPCYQPDTLVSHASFAFNSYYQQNGATDIACSFGGAGVKTNKNPSYDNCLYMTTGGNVTAMHAASSTITCDISVLIAGYLLLLLLSCI